VTGSPSRQTDRSEAGGSAVGHPANTPLIRIGSTSAYQFAAQVVALGVNFIVSVLVARTLGPEGKGQLSVLQQVPGILIVVLNFGLSYSNFYFVGRRKQPREKRSATRSWRLWRREPSARRSSGY